MRTSRPGILFPLLAAMLLAVPACDSNDGKTDIKGLWRVPGADVIYYNIGTSTITIYDYLGDEFDQGPDCYVITTLEIVRRDGTSITVSSPDFPGIQVVLTMERDGETLSVSSAGSDTEHWEKSTLSTSSFTPICTGTEVSKAPVERTEPVAKLPGF